MFKLKINEKLLALGSLVSGSMFRLAAVLNLEPPCLPWVSAYVAKKKKTPLKLVSFIHQELVNHDMTNRLFHPIAYLPLLSPRLRPSIY